MSGYQFQGFGQRQGQDGATTAPGGSANNSPTTQSGFKLSPRSATSSPTKPATQTKAPTVAFSPPGRGAEAGAPVADQKEKSEATLQAMSNAAVEWDNEMDSLDKKQEQLLNDQWRLLRTQIGSLMGALAEIRMEVSDLKENTLSKDVEAVINNLIGNHEDHGEKHSGLLERVAYLEQFVGESADRHAKDAEEAGGSFEDHKTTMETRLEYMEGLLGDTADKHSKELEAARAHTDAAHSRLEDLHNAIRQCAQVEHHASVEERVEFLEKMTGESVDKHDVHKVSTEGRLDFLEGLLGDNADKHSEEIEAMKASMEAKNGSLTDAHANMQKAIGLCAQHDHASGLETRMEYLEKVLGESADMHAKHSEHSTTMETRVEYLEGLMGDSADNHVKEIEALRNTMDGKHVSLEEAIGLCAKHDHASGLESRMEYLESLLGESADKHAAHSQHKTTMETRLEYIEGLIGDSADKHAKEIEDAMAKIDGMSSHGGRVGSLEDAIKMCAKHDHATGIEDRVNFLEKCLGESSDKHDSHKVTMETRLEYIEALIGDNADKHWKEIQALADKTDGHKGSLGSLAEAIKATANGDSHSDLEKRVGYLENFLGESESKHASAKDQLADHATTMESRLEFIEATIGDSSDKHAKELSAAQDKLKDLHAAVNSCAKSEHHSSLEARLEYMEQLIGDSSDMHEKHKKEQEAHSSKMAGMKGEQQTRDQKHATLEDRLEALERKHGDVTDGHGRKMSAMEANHAKMKNAYDELNGLVRGEAGGAADRHGQVDGRLMSVENYLQQNVDRMLKEHEDHKAKVRDAQAKVDQQRGMFDSHKTSTEQRLENMEATMADSAGPKFADFTKDLEKRLYYMQEDAKRARDVLESSLQEQLRLEHSLHDENTRQMKEHWERELRARQAYQDQYKDLIQAERFSREALQQDSEQRVITLERSLGMETNRLWVAIDKHTHDFKEPMHLPTQTIVEVMKPNYVEVLQAPSTIVDVMDTHGKHHLEMMQTQGLQLGMQSPRVPPFNVIPGGMSPGGGSRTHLGSSQNIQVQRLTTPGPVMNTLPLPLQGVQMANVLEPQFFPTPMSARATFPIASTPRQ